VTVSRGDTLSAIANACGISLERLRDANPGVQPRSLQAGTFLVIPRGAINTPPQRIGRPSIELAPRLQIAPGTASPTVILPPQPIPVPRQHILPGFGSQPGQLPLPPGHAPDFP
jgi:LysM repeat protein